MNRLVFLKLGGSLITDKTRPYTPRLDKMKEICTQVKEAQNADRGLKLVLGHGSGSFGHAAASRYHTQRGVSGPEAWRGFSEVWYQASVLNRLVLEAMFRVGVKAVALAPVASVTARDGKVAAWDLTPLHAVLENGLLPVVYGDVVIDLARGGTILSTEDLFAHLAAHLHPQRILLAGLEEGVWADFPSRKRLVGEITPETFAEQLYHLGGADGADVTGGMHAKVSQMVALVEQIPDLDVLIFSGEGPTNIQDALLGRPLGTIIHR